MKILPSAVPFHKEQLSALQYVLPNDPTFLEHQLATKRVLFIDTPVDEGSKTYKTNRHEAWKLVEIIQGFQRIYKKNNIAITSQSIGIITPYRAQIAQICQQLLEEKMDFANITIDTVERYQGGARDIILISLCTNTMSQLESLVSLSEEGDDRRLNVALTRARKHLVIVGNEGLLKGNKVYGELVRKIGG